MSNEFYRLTVNGNEHEVRDAWAGESLMYVLRERLGLPGTKGACEQGECGSCTVLMDGEAICSCLVMAATAVDAQIVTVEGLSSDPTHTTPTDVQQAFIDAIRHMLLPSVVLATYPTTVMIRFTRDSMLAVLEQSYIKTARAKGLNRGQVLYRHGLRNALLPVIRQIGLQFSTLITLAMITEVIFSWPGVGRWLIDSIYQRNYPAIQSGLLVISTLVITANMLTEVLHTLFNPLARKR